MAIGIDETVESEHPSPACTLLWRYARRHPCPFLEELRLLFRGGKLSPKYGDWDNVIRHCLAETAAVEVLSSLLNLPEDQAIKLQETSLAHDWKKRFDKKAREFNIPEIRRAIRLLKEAGLDRNLREATSPGFARAILNGEADLSQKILFYVDSITRGDQIVGIEARIQEAAERTQEEYGSEFWEEEKQAAAQVEQELYELLKQEGHEIDQPSEIPDLIKKGIEELIASNPQ